VERACQLVCLRLASADHTSSLGAFSTIPIWVLAILGVPARERDVYAYLAVWRQVGFYLGISPSILRDGFSTPARADKFLASSIIHHFTPISGDATLTAPTLPILRALANRPPTHTSFEYNCALARHLIGPGLADHLHIPPTSLRTAVRMHAALALQALPVRFGRVWSRAGWHAARRFYVREALVVVVQTNLGMRRTAFRPREPDGVDLNPDVLKRERVLGNPAGASRVYRAMYTSFAEMAAVMAFGAGAMLWLSYMLVQVLVRW
jgi:hypothetical protein